MKYPNFVGIISVIVYALLLSPLIVIIGSSFTSTEFISFPPEGFSLHWFAVALTDAELLESITTAIVVASLASIISWAIGTLASFAIVRYRFRGRNFLGGFFLSPLTIPMVVLAIGMLFFMSTFHMITLTGLVIGHVIITVPYLLRTVSASLMSVDRSIERAAMSLGANEVTTFFRVTLPLIKPGMIAGVLFSFILSFNNVTVSLFLARPGLQTLPVRIFYYIEAFPDPRISAISTVVVIFSLAFMIVLDRMFGLYKMFLPRATK